MTTESVYYCARHPSTETLLRCGRCETFICPRCAVFTDVGARCPDCAPRRKLPQVEVGPLFALRAAAAAAFAGAIIGAAWGLLLPGGFGFFTIFLGVGIGWVVVTAITLATNKKLGPVMQTIAILGVLLAYLVRNVTAGYALIPTDDLGGLLALAAGVIFAFNQLRY
jgi:hypothetical protein